MKVKINQQDEELSEKNVRIEKLQHQLLVGSQTETVGIYLLNNFHKL